MESKNHSSQVIAKKICLVSDHHLCTNPRLWKEAMTLAANGYMVTIVTIFQNEASLKRDNELLAALPAGIQYVSAASYIEGQMPAWKKILYKGVAKAAILVKKAGIDTVYLLSANPNAIYRKALEIDADLYICHIDCSLHVGQKLIKTGKRVAFDFEDWYSRDYLVPTRPVALLKQLERYALKYGVYVSCPSHTMADAIYKDYGIRKPEVIYNGFPSEPLINHAKTEMPSLVWFSQTIGPGRGLEKIIDVLEYIQSPVSLTLVGDISEKYRNDLLALFKKCEHHKLIVTPQVRHADLHRLLSQHTIGLALEENFPENKDTTISNKILQYLQAGLAVLATGTAGQKEVAADFRGLVRVVPPDDIGTWAAELQILIRQDKTMQEDVITRFNLKYSWEAQEAKLLQLVGAALDK